MEDKQRFPDRRRDPDNFRQREDPEHTALIQLDGNASTQQHRISHSSSHGDHSTQEQLEFDTDTGKLVLSANPQPSQVTSVPLASENPLVVAGVQPQVPDRPVVDGMASQGFFNSKMMNVL